MRGARGGGALTDFSVQRRIEEASRSLRVDATELGVWVDGETKQRYKLMMQARLADGVIRFHACVRAEAARARELPHWSAWADDRQGGGVAGRRRHRAHDRPVLARVAPRAGYLF